MEWNLGYYAYAQAAAESSSVPEDTNSGDETTVARPGGKSNLPVWGNERTMNLNPLILTNIQNSHYFKTGVTELKTYHEVVDEIYYKVEHLEPWERGSRKTTGQTGMCGGVRGVGAGGIVSTAYCLLYKLFTLRLTRKQLISLIKHKDSPYIRGLGFMYIRYTQPPADLWSWYEPYLDDEEEIDPKAGGGQPMTVGTMLRHMLTKLEWFETLFPRIPVPIQISMDKKLAERYPSAAKVLSGKAAPKARENSPPAAREQRQERPRQRSRSPRDRYRDKDRDRERHRGDRDRERGDRYRRERSRSRERDRRDRERKERDHHRDRRRRDER